MAQVVVQSDADQSILMSEKVLPVHLDSDQSALQFLERLYSAVEDKEAPDRARRVDVRRRTEAARRERKRR